MEIDERELLRLVGKILKELLKDEDISREKLIKVAEALEKADTYFRDLHEFKVIKKRMRWNGVEECK